MEPDQNQNDNVNYPQLDVHSDISLASPDIKQIRSDRFERNRQVMSNLDPAIAKKVFPVDEPEKSRLEKCAICIQRHYRGYRGRKRYVELLYEQFTQEEKAQHNKVLEQMEEGELLVENHKLEVLLDDRTTTRKNKTRKYLTNIITIQRAWRSYMRKHSKDDEDVNGRSHDTGGEIDDTGKDTGTEKEVMTLSCTHIDPKDCETERSQSKSVNTDSDISNEILKDKFVDKFVNNNNSIDNIDSLGGISAPANLQNYTANSLSLSTPEESTNRQLHDSTPEDDRIYSGFTSLGHKLLNKVKHERDIDSESLSSDYSEVSVPLRDFTESEVQIVQKTDLTHGNFLPSVSLPSKDSLEQQPNETEEEFSRRVRKVNLLSIAQEFAELKKVNADALPFDLHKNQGDLDGESSSSEASSKPSSVMSTPSDPSVSLTQLGHIRSDTSTNDWNCNLPNATPNLTDVPDSLSRLTESNTTEQSKYRKNAQNDENQRKRVQSSDRSKRERSLEREEEGDFDVYNIETTLPQMDWDSLEQQLNQATQVQQQRQEAQRNDREEIRRKLAMGIGMEEDFSNADNSLKKSNLTSRMYGGKPLQVCFMNENQDNENQNTKPDLSSAKTSNNTTAAQMSTNLQLKLSPTRQRTENKTGEGQEKKEGDEDFFKKQAQLQREAKIALAQASTMAHMQLEVEKQMVKKSPIAEIVGLPNLGDFRLQKMGRGFLVDMNIAQLQVVVNDLHTQIENLNEDLVKLLMERDDLHMSQDSMLVDIEDLTRRAELNANKVNHKSKKDSRKS